MFNRQSFFSQLSLKPKKVLVYYYDDAVGRAITRRLQYQGYVAEYIHLDNSTPAQNLAEDIEIGGIDLVVLPLYFGSLFHDQKRGLEAIVKIRERSRVPIIVLSTDSSNYGITDLVNVSLIGAEGFVVLPNGVLNIAEMADQIIINHIVSNSRLN